MTLTADPNNQRVHGDSVPDFPEGLAMMLDEGGEKQSAMSGFTLVVLVVEFGQLPFGRYS
jgi:hypothetical protein